MNCITCHTKRAKTQNINRHRVSWPLVFSRRAAERKGKGMRGEERREGKGKEKILIYCWPVARPLAIGFHHHIILYLSIIIIIII